MIRLSLPFTLLLLATACGFAGAEQAPENESRSIPSARAVRVEAIALEPATAELRLDLPGEVGGVRDALLAAANGGLVESVNVVEGQDVAKGTVIARVDAALYAAQLAVPRRS